MIGEIALAIEMGADTVDIGKTIHPHPTLGESIGMAAEVAHRVLHGCAAGAQVISLNQAVAALKQRNETLRVAFLLPDIYLISW